MTVLGSFVLASVAVPFLPQWAGPLAVAQARKPQSSADMISEPSQASKISRSQTVTSPSSRSRRAKTSTTPTSPSDAPLRKRGSAASLTQEASSRPKSIHVDGSQKHAPYRNVLADLNLTDARLSSSSLPDIRIPKPFTRPPTPASAVFDHRSLAPRNRRYSHPKRPVTPNVLSFEQKVKLLRQNYFRCETLFLTALEDISNRLVSVPKAARLSALRAELALIAQDLPAEVDVPVICPATLIDGIPSKSKHHRIIRLNPAEATVLNSAEKVPYLLMVEVLRDDFSFDPETAENQALLRKLLTEQGTNRRRIFDISEASRFTDEPQDSEKLPDSVFEPSLGDLGSSPLISSFDDEPSTKENVKSPRFLPRTSSGATTLSMLSNMETPRTSGTSNSRSTSPGPLRKMTLPSQNRSTASDQPDFSALATHMRTASQMLAQLESTSGKRPRGEVAAIRARIIASMQSLEEQSFENDDTQTPTFDAIMANANVAAAGADPDEIDEERTVTNAINSGAGIARMENDQKTGGVQRKADRDDPSAATFGEAWSAKKERIRKSSPYGWMKNWDLLSVIIKTGADLRQEAFACQLIRVCDKIWLEAGVPVWVKRMRILVTGESSGLIETITNGVSLHSLKRSLTLATIASGQNPRGRIATLKDHFVKAFGNPDTDAYKAGKDAFKRSLAAYSIISYVLQLKDRHNGNVLIDNEGHIIHIDFGFMLSNSPGSMGFEAAPFKLTQDYVDVLGGVASPGFEEYKQLCKQAFQGMLHRTCAGFQMRHADLKTALRRHADNIVDLVSIMGRDSNMPCYASGVQQVTNSLRQRFQLQLSADEAEQFVETDLIGKSLGSYYTRL